MWGGREIYGPPDQHGPRSLGFVWGGTLPEMAAAAETIHQAEKIYGPAEYWKAVGHGIEFVTVMPRMCTGCYQQRFVFFISPRPPLGKDVLIACHRCVFGEDFPPLVVSA